MGAENIFIFGLTTQQIKDPSFVNDPFSIVRNDAEIQRALQLIEHDFFSLVEPGIFAPILHSLLEQGDRYLVLSDLRSYIDEQDRVDAAFRNPDDWARKAILNVARSGKFSSDRTINEYATEVWHVKPITVAPIVPFTDL